MERGRIPVALYDVTMTKNLILNQENFICDSEAPNADTVAPCVESYIIRELNCSLPWIESGQGVYPPCRDAKDWDRYLQLSRYGHSSSIGLLLHYIEKATCVNKVSGPMGTEFPMDPNLPPCNSLSPRHIYYIYSPNYPEPNYLR